MRTKEKYREYLKSKDWKQKRKKKLSKAKKKCHICSEGLGLDVHRVMYKQWYDVETGDLRIVCRECHKIIHKLEKEGRIKYKKNNSSSKFDAQEKAVVAYRRQKAIEEAGGILKCKKCGITEERLDKKQFKQYLSKHILCKRCRNAIVNLNSSYIREVNKNSKVRRRLNDEERKRIWASFIG